MNVLFPPPGAPEPSWQQRFKTWFVNKCSVLAPRLREWNHVSHIVGASAFIILVVAAATGRHWETLGVTAEWGSAILLSIYFLTRAVLFVAKRVDVSTTLILNEWDNQVDRALASAGQLQRGLLSQVRFVRSESDLDAVVTLTHDSLGVEHEDIGFSRERRKELYFSWIKANPYSILILSPNYGRAAGEPIGVSIILPLRDTAVSQMWDGCGVLGLWSSHILPSRSRLITSILIDTLLLREDVIDDYRQLAVQAFHLHMGRFYRSKHWPLTTVYTITLKPKICALLNKRGFQLRTKSKEGEDLFQFVVQHAATLPPLQRERYNRIVRLIRLYSDEWRTIDGAAKNGGA
ncbi:MAG TPA: hypothetical protein VI636_14095 [Candidatus Angelobacter sp.]